MELAALLVTIGTRPNGEADHPDFNQLPSVQASGMDWAHYVDTVGSGWIYDGGSGHRQDGSGRGKFRSPVGQQLGLLLVPESFADEAEAAFPATCQRVDEPDAADFFDNFARANQEDVIVKEPILSALEQRIRIGKAAGDNVDALEQELREAANPDDPRAGVTRNVEKTLARLKAARGITIKNKAR